MVEFFKFDRLLAAGSLGCFTPGSVYGARCRHSGRPRWPPRSRTGHAVPLSRLCPCAAKINPDSRKEGLYLKGSLQDGEREYFSRENAHASCCQGCPPPRAPEERGLFAGRSELGEKEVYSGTILCSAFWGRGCMLGRGWVQVQSPMGRRGAELRFRGRTELTSALFRWSCV